MEDKELTDEELLKVSKKMYNFHAKMSKKWGQINVISILAKELSQILSFMSEKGVNEFLETMKNAVKLRKNEQEKMNGK